MLNTLIAFATGIMTVVIFSVNAHPRRAFPHISQEMYKRSPTSTDINPATSVLWETWVFGIRTSLNHATPRIVSRRFIVAVSVFRKHLGNYFSMKAPAGSCRSIPQMPIGDSELFSTIANDQAPCCGFSRWLSYSGSIGDNQK